MPWQQVRTTAVFAAILVAYVVAGRWGLALATVHASATAIWAPTGIAIAALLIWGRRYWPAVFLAALIVNLGSFGSLSACLGIAAGNTLEAVVGAALIEALAHGRQAYDRAADVFRAAGVAGLLAPMISATVGVLSLALAGDADWARFGAIWMTWWLGDAGGALVVAPMIVLWSQRRVLELEGRAIVHALLAGLALVAVTRLVFGEVWFFHFELFPFGFLTLPLLAWIAFRFGPRETATASALLAVVAIWSLVARPEITDPAIRDHRLLLLQVFLGTTATTMLALAAEAAERRRTLEALRLLESAVEKAGEGIFVLAADPASQRAEVRWVNDGVVRIVGRAREQLVGQKLLQLGAHFRDPTRFEELCALIHDRRTAAGEFEIEGMDGRVRAVELRVEPAGRERWVGILRDVTESRAQRLELERQAMFDFLTGLPNRRLFQDRLEQAILFSGREEHAVALLILDLDHFKDVNDTFGHAAGDQLLMQVGARLERALRSGDTVARLGGDEFALVVPSAGGLEGAARVASKIVKALESPPFEIAGRSVDVAASIGIALCPQHGQDRSTLMRLADIALYAAKRSRRGYAIYASGDDSGSRERLAFMGDLRRGLEHGQFRLLYQPRVAIGDGRVSSVVAELLWLHPHLGRLRRDRFWPSAERIGLIRALEEWTLKEALSQARAWSEAHVPLRVVVDVTAPILLENGFADRLESMLVAERVAPGRLRLRISSRELMSETEAMIAVISELRRCGIRTGLDGFGEGSSVLSVIERVPVDEIGLGRAIASALESPVVKNSIDLIHALGRRAVVGHVATDSAFRRLGELGCDLAQGEALAPPLFAEEVPGFLAESRWSAIQDREETWC